MVRAVVFEGTGSFAPLAEPRQPTLGLAGLRRDVPGVGRGTGQPRASRGNGVAVRELPVCSDPHVLEGTGIFATGLILLPNDEAIHDGEESPTSNCDVSRHWMSWLVAPSFSASRPHPDSRSRPQTDCIHGLIS